MMKQLLKNSMLYGANAPFIEELYEDYLQCATSVPPEWRGYFDGLQQGQAGGAADISHGPVIESFIRIEKERRRNGHSASYVIHDEVEERKQVSVLQIINAYRFLGVRQANLDPLKRLKKPYISGLDPSFYGLTEEDMGTVFNTGSLVGPDLAPLRKILQLLKQIYCGNIGVEYMYMTDTEQKRWIQNRLEGTRAHCR